MKIDCDEYRGATVNRKRKPELSTMEQTLTPDLDYARLQSWLEYVPDRPHKGFLDEFQAQQHRLLD